MASTALHRVLRIAVAAAVLGTAPAQADILVGVAAPLTGPYEWGGEEAEHGVELAAAELNAAGGPLGRRVRLSLAYKFDRCLGSSALSVQLTPGGIRARP